MEKEGTLKDNCELCKKYNIIDLSLKNINLIICVVCSRFILRHINKKIIVIIKNKLPEDKRDEINKFSNCTRSEMLTQLKKIGEQYKEIFEGFDFEQFFINIEEHIIKILKTKKVENEINSFENFEKFIEEINRKAAIQPKAIKQVGKKSKKEEKSSFQIREVSTTDKLNYILKKVFLFHDQFNEPYIVVEINNHKEIHHLKSKYAKRWLSDFLWANFYKVPTSNQLNDILRVLEAKACNAEKHKLHNRVAWYNNELYYDLTNENWQVIKINENGWEVIDNPPILFRRYQHQQLQVRPVKNGNFQNISKFFNLKNSSDIHLCLVIIISYIIPDIPHVVTICHGDQGSAKSTLHTLIKKLIDPSSTILLSPPKDLTQFVQTCSHHWCVFYDNLSYLPDWLSDAICRAVTGSGFSKRELWTDDDDFIYFFLRCFGLNGINIPATKPDLLDRGVLFKFERISKKERISEEEFWSDFEKNKPLFLGDIFNIISKAMKIKKELVLKETSRMADFCKWGEAISQVMGYEPNSFIRNYFVNIGVQNTEALENNIIGPIILKIVNDGGFDGTPSQLLEKVNLLAPELRIDMHTQNYPKTPTLLSRRLNEIKSNLQDYGISVENGYKGASRNICIKKTASVTSTAPNSTGDINNKDDINVTDSAFPIENIASKNDTDATDDKIPTNNNSDSSIKPDSNLDNSEKQDVQKINCKSCNAALRPENMKGDYCFMCKPNEEAIG